ncbi:MAG: hypothetical protein COB20_15630 [SAR86 cluster bacterium]|uniref:Uncharacterized protein n=1 Tax=SAR86 cluster bacterium TaxID=2030880 RepID=A0A2A4WU83_9GAMM|nr:MAG: hypothetical protein COB20_15630 [SAR86 cluster bacterium]
MDLEYKTIQAQTPLFADSKQMHAMLEEEAKAGWQMLWKEDNYKIKLQRETSHRENDKNLDFDAYRSTVGVSSVVTYVGTALLTLAIVSVILYFAIWAG